MFIYKITDIESGKSYIGKTVRTVEERFDEHKKSHYLFKSIYKKDQYRLAIEVVDQASTEEELNLLEKKYIREFKTLAPEGFNLCEGGNGGDNSKNIDYKNRKSRTYTPSIVLSEEEEQSIIKYYTEDDTLSFKDIGNKLSISEYFVKRTVDSKNIPRRKWKRKEGNRLIKFSFDEIELIKKMYSEGSTQTSIGKEFGVTQGVIKRVLNEK
jgi:DNA-directed RNA polymerase specialized sigma subunit